MGRLLAAVALAAVGLAACGGPADGLQAQPGEDSGTDSPSADAQPETLAESSEDAPRVDTSLVDGSSPTACSSCGASQACCSLTATPAGGGFVCKDSCDVSANEEPIGCTTTAECTAKYGKTSPYCMAVVSGVPGTDPSSGISTCELRVVSTACTDPGHPLDPRSDHCSAYDPSTASGGAQVVLCTSDSDCTNQGAGHCCPTSGGFGWSYCASTCWMI